MTDHVHTLLRQAKAFLAQRDAGRAIPLLEQARMLARENTVAQAEVRFQQAVAHEMIGNCDRALQLVRRALELDPRLRAKIGDFAYDCQRRGNTALSDQLVGLLPPVAGRASVRNARTGRRAPVVLALFLATIGVSGSIWYFGVRPRQGRSAEGPYVDRFDIGRIRENVGLVLVTAEYTALDGSPLQIPLATGSCFAVSADGLLLTNKHVTQARETAPDRLLTGATLLGVQPKWKVVACFGAEEKQHCEARIVYESPYYDLAVLKVNRMFARYLKLARRAQPGDDVYAVGFPGKVNELLNAMDPSAFWTRTAESIASGGFDLSSLSLSPADYDVTVTRGVVSAIRHVDATEWIQHDAVVSAGSSGGPLVTRSCRIVGMNTLKHATSEGFNLAFTLDQIRSEIAPFVTLD